MLIKGDGIARATSRGALDAFVRVVSQPDRRILAIADGHSCGWDCGVEEISGAVLHGIDRALSDDPSAPVEVLFEAAREQFLRAAEPYPEDEDLGGPVAHLTIVELTPGRLRAGKLGEAEILVVRDGLSPGALERTHVPLMARAPAVPTMVERKLRAGDLIVVSSEWVNPWRRGGLAGVIEELARAHSAPRYLVAATVARWRDEVRRSQQEGTLIGEPSFAIAVTRA